MDEELHNRGAGVDLLGLELVDLVIRAAPLRFAGKALDAFDQDPSVPAAVEYGDFPGAR